MRTLDKNTNGSMLSNQKKIDELENTLKALSTVLNQLSADINTIKQEQTAERQHINTQSITSPVGTFDRLNVNNSINVDEITTDDVATETIEATTATITRVNANDIVSPEGSIDTLDSNSIETDEATIGSLTATDATITNLSFENFSAGSVEADNVNAETVDVGETLTALNVNATEITSGSIAATVGTVNGLDASVVNAENVVSDEAKTDSLSAATISHKDYYITLPTPVSDTNFNIIELPRITSGNYRVTMTDVNNEVLFSFTLNDIYYNISFTYSRGDESKYLDKVAIYGGQVYLQTWYGGKLYYHNDSLDSELAPSSYSDWPIPLDALDYPIYTCSRKDATVYTKYSISNISDRPIGTALLDIEKTDKYALQEAEGNELQYDPNTDVHYYAYVPDQAVNTTSDVEFNKVEATTAEITNLIVENGTAGQVLRENADGAALSWETPTTKSVDGYLDQKSNKLITESAVAHWDGGNYTVNEEGTIEVGTPSITKVGDITTGTWSAGKVSTAEADIVALNADTIETTGDVHIAGDLTVDGVTTTIHTEEITTDSNTITLRHEATTGIQPGEVSGIEIENYDGNHNTLQLAVDNEGTLRLGTDIGTSGGDNEPVLTRSETADLTNDNLLKWDNENLKAVDSGKSIDDLMRFEFVKKPSNIGLADDQTYTTTYIYDNMPFRSIAYIPSTYISDGKGTGTYVIYKTGYPHAEFIPKVETNPTNVGTLTAAPTTDLHFYMNANSDGTSLSGTWISDGSVMTSTGLVLFGSNDIDESTAFSGKAGTLCIGNPTGIHVEFDNNEIIAKDSATTYNGNLYVIGNVKFNDSKSTLKIPLQAPASPANGMIWIE